MNNRSDTILVIDDNDDFCSYLEELLSRNNCEVIIAHDGSDGFDKAVSAMPDLIITDLKMDGIDGWELCNKVISNKIVGHIPIIILTGMEGDKNLKKGLEQGAVDYLVKPVNSDVLVMKVKNILSARKKFTHQNWAHLLQKTFDESDLTEDEEFLQSIYQIIADNIGRYDFGVCNLASALNVSERTLYRRVKQLTSVPVAGIIREVRLQRARELLVNDSVRTKQELARMIGYKSTTQFSHAFKKRFGELPDI